MAGGKCFLAARLDVEKEETVEGPRDLYCAVAGCLFSAAENIFESTGVGETAGRWLPVSPQRNPPSLLGAAIVPTMCAVSFSPSSLATAIL